MKTITRNISLPVELDAWAARQAKQQDFTSVNAYIREVLRRAWQADIDTDLAFLTEAIQGAPKHEPDAATLKSVVESQRRYWTNQDLAR